MLNRVAVSFQFYKVRLKPVHLDVVRHVLFISILQSSIKTFANFKKLNINLISILQSSIKTTRATKISKPKLISILQSSIKTQKTTAQTLQYIGISILQSSIKTTSCPWHRSWPRKFQFYKVRLKLGTPSCCKIRSIFQFYKVRLKRGADGGRRCLRGRFQFYKVRLKLFPPATQHKIWQDFNSTKFD